MTSAKCPERLLQVAAMAKEAGLPVRFKWVGDGELRAEIEQKRDSLGLTDMVEFTGFVRNPFPHIKAADLMMVTSDFEGFCLVICEAQCLGVPVISTRTAGPAEIIGDNEYGLLTDISAKALFEALKQCVESHESCISLAQKALHRPDSYSVESTVDNLYSLI